MGVVTQLDVHVSLLAGYRQNGKAGFDTQFGFDQAQNDLARLTAGSTNPVFPAQPH